MAEFRTERGPLLVKDSLRAWVCREMAMAIWAAAVVNLQPEAPRVQLGTSRNNRQNRNSIAVKPGRTGHVDRPNGES